MTSSLLGHLSTNFGDSTENLATEALAYLLQKPVAREALRQFLTQTGPRLPAVLDYRTQQVDEGGSRPDLIGYDPEGRKRVIVEAKFWAGLTAQQPKDYLAQLPADEPSLLVFVAPAVRIEILWNEIRRRAVEASWSLEEQTGHASDLRWAGVGGERVMAITSWRAVLSGIRAGLNASSDLSSLSDVDQLLGLCDQMDTNAFLPLTSEELTSTIGRRLVQFGELIDDVANRAVVRGIATTVGSKAAGGNAYYLRPIKIEGWSCLVSCSCHSWGTISPHPIALMLSGQNNKAAKEVRELAASLPKPLSSYLRNGRWEVGLPLPTGVERDKVLDVLYGHLMVIASSIVAYHASHPALDVDDHLDNEPGEQDDIGTLSESPPVPTN